MHKKKGNKPLKLSTFTVCPFVFVHTTFFWRKLNLFGFCVVSLMGFSWCATFYGHFCVIANVYYCVAKKLRSLTSL